MTGTQPIGVRWSDPNKSDDTTPDYRSKLVASEVQRNALDELFAATPAIGAKRLAHEHGGCPKSEQCVPQTAVRRC